MNHYLTAAILLGLACVGPVNAQAPSYPKQSINLIIPLAPGDATDIAGRTIGTDSAAKAPKDGYTTLITNNASMVFNRVLTLEAVPYAPYKDLYPWAWPRARQSFWRCTKTRRSKTSPR